MNRFDEEIIIGKPFGAVFLGVQWKDGVLQQGWSEKAEHKTKSGKYLGTYSHERWEDVPGTPPAPPKAAEGERETVEDVKIGHYFIDDREVFGPSLNGVPTRYLVLSGDREKTGAPWYWNCAKFDIHQGDFLGCPIEKRTTEELRCLTYLGNLKTLVP